MEYSRHHNKHSLFNNPKEFVSSLNQIDQDQITKMKGMVNDLIEEGETERDILTASRDAGKDDEANKEAARLVATAAETSALEDLTAGKQQLVTYQGLEAEAGKLQAEDKVTQNDARVDMDSAQSVMDTQNIRIDSEKQTLEEVKQLIVEINEQSLAEMKKGRNLLNIVDYKALANADPGSIQEVVDLVDELITAGETERSGYIDTWNVAVAAFNLAASAFDDSYRAWEITKGQVARQIMDNDGVDQSPPSFTEVLETATAANQVASDLKNEATAELKRREDHLAAETIRLDDEKATCEDVIILLDDLLKEE